MIAFISLAISVVALAIVAHIYLKQNEVINEVVVEYGEGAVPLKKAHRGDACYDLCVNRDVILKNGRQVLPTGIRLGLPLGYHAFILPTSGNCSKGMNARIVNEAGEKVEYRIDADVEIGTIDNCYRGKLGVILNIDQYLPKKDVVFIERGIKVAQLWITKGEEFMLTEDVISNDTDRGSDGYGSTDKKA